MIFFKILGFPLKIFLQLRKSIICNQDNQFRYNEHLSRVIIKYFDLSDTQKKSLIYNLFLVLDQTSDRRETLENIFKSDQYKTVLIDGTLSALEQFNKNAIDSNTQNNFNFFGKENDLTRDKWVKKTLSSLRSGIRILDAGAGEKRYQKYCEHLNYVSQDNVEYTGTGNEGLHVKDWNYGKIDIVSDILNIPESDGSFDAVICTEVLEHIPNPVAVFDEFSRLLVSGGTLIMTAPFCSLTHFAPYYYCNGFSKYFYEHHLTRCKFQLCEISYNGTYLEYLAQELYRLEQVAKEYHGDELSDLSVELRDALVKNIYKYSLNTTKSHELLCFGLHIIAKKI